MPPPPQLACTPGQKRQHGNRQRACLLTNRVTAEQELELAQQIYMTAHRESTVLWQQQQPQAAGASCVGRGHRLSDRACIGSQLLLRSHRQCASSVAAAQPHNLTLLKPLPSSPSSTRVVARFQFTQPAPQHPESRTLEGSPWRCAKRAACGPCRPPVRSPSGTMTNPSSSRRCKRPWSQVRHRRRRCRRQQCCRSVGHTCPACQFCRSFGIANAQSTAAACAAAFSCLPLSPPNPPLPPGTALKLFLPLVEGPLGGPIIRKLMRNNGLPQVGCRWGRCICGRGSGLPPDGSCWASMERVARCCCCSAAAGGFGGSARCFRPACSY